MNSDFYKLLIQQSPIGYSYQRIIYDENGVAADFEFIDVNESFEKITGIKRSVIIKKGLKDILSSIDSSSINWIKSYSDISLNGAGNEFELYSNLSKRWYRANFYDYNKGYYITYITDMYKEKTRIDELTALFDINFILLCINDPEGNFIEINKRFKEVLGYSAEQLSHKTLLDFVHPDDVVSTSEAIKKIDDNKVHTYVNRIKCKEGSYHSFEWSSYSNGKLIYSSAKDISDQKLTENKIEKSEEQSRLLISQMQLGLALHEIILDDTGIPVDYRFIDVNDSYERLTGLCRADIIGKTVLQVLPHTEKYWIDTFGQVALTGQSTQIEKYSLEFDRYYKVTAYSPKLGQFAVIFDDVTKAKKTEEELKKKEEILNLFFKQSLTGFFIMMIDEPIAWNESIDKEKTLDYVFDHEYFIKVNQAMLDQYDISEDELLNKTPNKLFANDLERWRLTWKELFDKGFLHVERSEERFDSTPVWFIGDYVCIYDSQGRIIGHFGTQLDLSEIKKGRKKLNI